MVGFWLNVLLQLFSFGWGVTGFLFVLVVLLFGLLFVHIMTFTQTGQRSGFARRGPRNF